MVGGVLAITPEQFKTVNGFSNQFYGWGGEDDDFYSRLRSANLEPWQLSSTLGRYAALKHTKQEPADNLHLRLEQARSFKRNHYALDFTNMLFELIKQFDRAQCVTFC
jgi:predicted glycosyltransferase involved in capsule biosynthesis